MLRLVEELRPQIPEWFFRLLCVASDIGFGFTRKPRGWMLRQPFRWMLFRKLSQPAQEHT